MATMTDELVYAYAEIVKTEKNADGDVFVFGKAAGPEVDLDGQIADPVWLKSAMPDWMKWGNIRAMHAPIAAGIGVDLQDTGNGAWTLKSLVVDQDSKDKVDKKVYKGYSIGIKNARVVRDPKAPKGRIVGGDIVEISLVDRPANPTTTMMLCKMAGGAWSPVDEEGEVLKVAEPDLIKSARATVRQVLHDDLVVQLDDAGDITAAKAAMDKVCDLIIHSATLLKSAAPDDTVDIGDLQDAVSALGEFADTGDGPEYDGVEHDAAAYAAQMDAAAAAAVEKALTRTLGADFAKMLTPDLAKALGVRSADAGVGAADGGSATLDTAEIIKAAVAEVKGPLEAKIESLQADLTKAMAAPRSGGPVLITQPNVAPPPKAAEANRLLAIADRTADPAMALAYREAAAKVGEVAA